MNTRRINSLMIAGFSMMLMGALPETSYVVSVKARTSQDIVASMDVGVRLNSNGIALDLESVVTKAVEEVLRSRTMEYVMGHRKEVEELVKVEINKALAPNKVKVSSVDITNLSFKETFGD